MLARADIAVVYTVSHGVIVPIVLILLPLLLFEIVQRRSLSFVVSSWGLFNRRQHCWEASSAAVVDID
jgi:hypothetical protein